MIFDIWHLRLRIQSIHILAQSKTVGSTISCSFISIFDVVVVAVAVVVVVGCETCYRHTQFHWLNSFDYLFSVNLNIYCEFATRNDQSSIKNVRESQNQTLYSDDYCVYPPAHFQPLLSTMCCDINSHLRNFFFFLSHIQIYIHSYTWTVALQPTCIHNMVKDISTEWTHLPLLLVFTRTNQFRNSKASGGRWWKHHTSICSHHIQIHIFHDSVSKLPNVYFAFGHFIHFSNVFFHSWKPMILSFPEKRQRENHSVIIQIYLAKTIHVYSFNLFWDPQI